MVFESFDQCAGDGRKSEMGTDDPGGHGRHRVGVATQFHGGLDDLDQVVAVLGGDVDRSRDRRECGPSDRGAWSRRRTAQADREMVGVSVLGEEHREAGPVVPVRGRRADQCMAGRERNDARAVDRSGMSVGDLGLRGSPGTRQFGARVRSDRNRRDAHGGTVATQPTVAGVGRPPPWNAGVNGVEHAGIPAVPAVGVGEVPSGEMPDEQLLIHFTGGHDGLADSERHRRVIGVNHRPWPGHYFVDIRLAHLLMSLNGPPQGITHRRPQHQTPKAVSCRHRRVEDSFEDTGGSTQRDISPRTR